jgi:hypothetical protein
MINQAIHDRVRTDEVDVATIAKGANYIAEAKNHNMAFPFSLASSSNNLPNPFFIS